MRLATDENLLEFRREFEEWLDAHLPGPDVVEQEHRNSSAHLPGWARDFQRELFEAGYLVPGWPPELGGRNATPQEQMIYFEVISERQVPRSLNPQGLSICAASIVEFGTDEQKARFVVPTLKGEITWCLGMSEPNAGSDLASLTHEGGTARGLLRRQRPEGVDVGRTRRRLLPLFRAHRPRGTEAPWHQRAHHRHAARRASRAGRCPN